MTLGSIASRQNTESPDHDWPTSEVVRASVVRASVVRASVVQASTNGHALEPDQELPPVTYAVRPVGGAEEVIELSEPDQDIEKALKPSPIRSALQGAASVVAWIIWLVAFLIESVSRFVNWIAATIYKASDGIKKHSDTGPPFQRFEGTSRALKNPAMRAVPEDAFDVEEGLRVSLDLYASEGKLAIGTDSFVMTMRVLATYRPDVPYVDLMGDVGNLIDMAINWHIDTLDLHESEHQFPADEFRAGRITLTVHRGWFELVGDNEEEAEAS